MREGFEEKRKRRKDEKKWKGRKIKGRILRYEFITYRNFRPLKLRLFEFFSRRYWRTIPIERFQERIWKSRKIARRILQYEFQEQMGKFFEKKKWKNRKIRRRILRYANREFFILSKGEAELGFRSQKSK